MAWEDLDSDLEELFSSYASLDSHALRANDNAGFSSYGWREIRDHQRERDESIPETRAQRLEKLRKERASRERILSLFATADLETLRELLARIRAKRINSENAMWTRLARLSEREQAA